MSSTRRIARSSSLALGLLLVSIARAQSQPASRPGGDDVIVDVPFPFARARSQPASRPGDDARLVAEIEMLERAVAATGPTAADVIQRALDQAVVIGPNARFASTELGERAGRACMLLRPALSRAALDDARALSARDLGLPALARYAQAEVATHQCRQVARDDKDEDARDLFDARYKAIVSESDALAARLFTPAFIAARPWRDLLSEPRAWNTFGLTMAGARARATFAGPALEVDRTEEETPASRGVVVAVRTVADRDRLRDIVIDLQLTIEKGTFHVGFRAGNVLAPERMPCIELTVEKGRTGAGAFEVGRSHDLEITLIGSKLTFVDKTAAPDQSVTEDISATKSRAGAIAFFAPHGSRYRITRLRIKDLRGG